MKKQSWFLLAVVLVLVGGTAGFLAHRQTHQKLGKPGVKVVQQPIHGPEGKVVGTNRVELPEQVLNFESEPQPVAQIVLDWLPKDTTYGQRIYKAPDGFESAINVVLMGSDRTSIHKPQFCLTGSGWQIDQTELTSIPVTEPHPYDLPVMKLTTSRELKAPNGAAVVRRGLYVYWFVADNQLTADHNQRMWWMARDMVRTGVLQRWAYVATFAICAPGAEEATFQRMKELIGAAVPQFQLAAGSATKLARLP